GWFYGQQEPAAFQAMYPDRDVLNGGALTPAGRLGLVRAGDAAPVFSPAAALPAASVVQRFHRTGGCFRGEISPSPLLSCSAKAGHPVL
ncbi:hypothetical protein ABTJ92_20120, partial [Acinetobacter baumannii]